MSEFHHLYDVDHHHYTTHSLCWLGGKVTPVELSQSPAQTVSCTAVGGFPQCRFKNPTAIYSATALYSAG